MAYLYMNGEQPFFYCKLHWKSISEPNVGVSEGLVFPGFSDVEHHPLPWIKP